MEETLETTEETEAGAATARTRSRAWTPGWPPTRSPSGSLMREDPVMSIDDLPSGRGVLLSRKEEIMETLRHPEIFSSNMDAVDLKNKRPMIPLQIDPPDHKKFRKLLDPIFAPRKMAAMDDEVSSLVNQLIDRFVDRGEVDFAKEFSIPFPSEVFLTLLGLPLDELDTFLTMKDGIIRPDHVTGKLYGSREAASTSRRSRTRSTTTSTRSSTCGRRSARTTCSRTSSTRRSRAIGSPARTSSTSASCSSSPVSTR